VLLTQTQIVMLSVETLVHHYLEEQPTLTLLLNQLMHLYSVQIQRLLMGHYSEVLTLLIIIMVVVYSAVQLILLNQLLLQDLYSALNQLLLQMVYLERPSQLPQPAVCSEPSLRLLLVVHYLELPPLPEIILYLVKIRLLKYKLHLKFNKDKEYNCTPKFSKMTNNLLLKLINTPN